MGIVIRSDFGASMCLGLARYPVRLLDKYVETRLQTPWLAIYTLSFLQGGGGCIDMGMSF